jgi:hypothetical protein
MVLSPPSGGPYRRRRCSVQRPRQAEVLPLPRAHFTLCTLRTGGKVFSRVRIGGQDYLPDGLSHRLIHPLVTSPSLTGVSVLLAGNSTHRIDEDRHQLSDNPQTLRIPLAEQFLQAAGHRHLVALLVCVGIDPLGVDGCVAEDFHPGLFVNPSRS